MSSEIETIYFIIFLRHSLVVWFKIKISFISFCTSYDAFLHSCLLSSPLFSLIKSNFHKGRMQLVSPPQLFCDSTCRSLISSATSWLSRQQAKHWGVHALHWTGESQGYEVAGAGRNPGQSCVKGDESCSWCCWCRQKRLASKAPSFLMPQEVLYSHGTAKWVLFKEL